MTADKMDRLMVDALHDHGRSGSVNLVIGKRKRQKKSCKERGY